MLPSLFVIGNPLLDITVKADDALFKKWNVEEGSINLADSHQKSLYQELMNRPDAKITSGGAAQNTARGVQYFLNVPSSVIYLGSVGDDETAKKLFETTSESGMKVVYFTTNADATGTCAVLLKNCERTLIANIGACNYLEASILDTPLILENIRNIKAFYSTGFVILQNHGIEILLKMGEYCLNNRAIFAFNLSAPYVINDYYEKLLQILPYVDILICNQIEASELAKKNGLEPDQYFETALRINKMPKKNPDFTRICIFTRGSNTTIVTQGIKVTEHRPFQIDEEKIVDLDGAGDAFVSGVLAGIIKGASLEKMIQAGHYASHKVIQEFGSIYSGVCEFEF